MTGTAKYRYAGVSVIYDKPTPGARQCHFHITKLEKQIAVWMKVPGKAEYTYIELPEPMNKLDAIRHCITVEDFQDPRYIKDYLVNLERHFDPEAREAEKLLKRIEGVNKIKNTHKKRGRPRKVTSQVHMIEDDPDDIPMELVHPEEKDNEE